MASKKKYKTLKKLAETAARGEFKGRVIVDNDCVDAYEDGDDGEHVFG